MTQNKSRQMYEGVKYGLFVVCLKQKICICLKEVGTINSCAGTNRIMHFTISETMVF